LCTKEKFSQKKHPTLPALKDQKGNQIFAKIYSRKLQQMRSADFDLTRQGKCGNSCNKASKNV
jgi:hypothetical protein